MAHINAIAVKRWAERVFNQLNQTIYTIEHRAGRLYNIVNVLIRVIGEAGIKAQLWKDLEEFNELFAKATVDLYKEAKAHEEKELERIKQEQHEGKMPAPMVPRIDEIDRITSHGQRRFAELLSEPQEAPGDSEGADPAPGGGAVSGAAGEPPEGGAS